MVQAREDSLELLLDNIKEHLETVTTLEFTDAIRRRPLDAIAPHLTTLRMLNYQEWTHKLDMVDASRKGSPVRFSRARMEGMFWEETGFVKASLFPQLCRLEGSVEVDGTDEDEEDTDDEQDDRYTVICKARVSVVDHWEEDMEDAEDIGVEVEIDLKFPETPRERAAEKIEKTIDLGQKPDRAQSRIQEEPQVTGEPMDVDRVGDLPGEEEAPRTPDRGISEIIIPDSVD